MTTKGKSGLIGLEPNKLEVPPGTTMPKQDGLNREKTWEEDGLDLADMPKPVGWRVLIEPIEIKQETAGGIIMPENVQEAAEYMRYVGLVVATGPEAYKHRKFSEGEPWCVPGDWVIYGRYAGQEAMVKGDSGIHSFRFVNDDEILAVAPKPEILLMYGGI